MTYYLGYGCFCEIDKEELPLLHNSCCMCSRYFDEATITSYNLATELNDTQIVDSVINFPIQKFTDSNIVLHANVIDIEGKYIALLGDSCIGKTLLTIKCVAQSNHNYKFVTDDLTLISKEGFVIPCCCRPILVRSKNKTMYVRSTDIFTEERISHDSEKLAGIVYLYSGSEHRSKIELLIKSVWNVTAKNLHLLMTIPFIKSPMIFDDTELTISILQKNLLRIGVL